MEDVFVYMVCKQRCAKWGVKYWVGESIGKREWEYEQKRRENNNENESDNEDQQTNEKSNDDSDMTKRRTRCVCGEEGEGGDDGVYLCDTNGRWC